MKEAILFAAGIIISSLSALLGVGGGVFTVPVLHYTALTEGAFPEHSGHMAISGSLLMAFGLSIAATLSNGREGRVDWKKGLMITTGNIPGALTGASLGVHLSSEYLTIFFSIFVFFTGLYSLWKLKNSKFGRESSQQSKPIEKRSPLSIVLPGFFVGILSSLTGVGGGVLMVPIFVHLYGLGIHRAVATSSFAIIFTSLAGVTGYTINALSMNLGEAFPEPSFGFLYFPYLIPLLVGGLLGGYLGARSGKKIKSDTITLLFSFLQIAVAIHMIYGVLFS